MKNLLILLSCFLFINCANEQQSNDNFAPGKNTQTYDGNAKDSAKDQSQTEVSSIPKLERGSKIIRSGRMNIEVKSLDNAKAEIDSILFKTKSYYENEQYTSQRYRKTYSLKIRVPNTKFDSLIFLLENGIGKLNSKYINANDVTEEYVDLNIRLENKLSYLTQYKEILSKAKTIKEILEVKEKISAIEVDIESKKGRLKFLEDKVNFSTLQLEISEPLSRTISDKSNFGVRIVNAFKSGIQALLDFVILLVNLWPFIVLVLLLYLGRKPILKRIRRRKNQDIDK